MRVRIDRVKLITEMARRDLNVKTLAERAGIRRDTVSDVRSGKTCKLETAEKIAAGLGVPLADLLTEV